MRENSFFINFSSMGKLFFNSFLLFAFKFNSLALSIDLKLKWKFLPLFLLCFLLCFVLKANLHSVFWYFAKINLVWMINQAIAVNRSSLICSRTWRKADAISQFSICAYFRNLISNTCCLFLNQYSYLNNPNMQKSTSY